MTTKLSNNISQESIDQTTDLSTQISNLNAALLVANNTIADRDAELLLKSKPYPNACYGYFTDHSQLPGDDWDIAHVQWQIDNLSNPTYLYEYYPHMQSMPDLAWENPALYRVWRYGDFTGLTSLPDVPVGLNPSIRYLWNDYSYNNGPSMGSVGINDIPTTWRQIKNLDRLYFNRNELTSAQQIGMVNGIERELIEGMGDDRGSTFYVYFTSTSTGKNDVMDPTTLLANGWAQSTATRLSKTIAGRLVYVYYIP